MGTKHFRPTEAHLVFLREQYQQMSQEKLREAFREKYGIAVSQWAMWNVLKKHGMTGTTRQWTEEEIDFIKEKFKVMPRLEIIPLFEEKFKVSLRPTQLEGILSNHKLRSGRNGYFREGHVPFNKGTKGLMKANSGTFQAGSIPPNINPLWHERVTKDGYIEIKVPEANPYTGASTRYRPKHQYVWEKENGPIPKGHAILFLNGNSHDCTPDNLMLITRAELICLNLLDYKTAPEELRPSILALAKMQAKAGVRSINGRTKGRKL